jgi:N-acetylmuramoyl-L-alanine amidase
MLKPVVKILSILMLGSITLITGLYAFDVYIATREIRCLALNIYHESRGEPFAGQWAVGYVTVNRTRSKNYPNNICQVVYQRKWLPKYEKYVGQFSWTTDGRVDQPIDKKAWERSILLARQVYFRAAENKVDNAMFYHADRIEPYWAHTLKTVKKLGHHIFYE